LRFFNFFDLALSYSAKRRHSRIALQPGAMSFSPSSTSATESASIPSIGFNETCPLKAHDFAMPSAAPPKRKVSTLPPKETESTMPEPYLRSPSQREELVSRVEDVMERGMAIRQKVRRSWCVICHRESPHAFGVDDLNHETFQFFY
jgi:hypothetical protein